MLRTPRFCNYGLKALYHNWLSNFGRCPSYRLPGYITFYYTFSICSRSVITFTFASQLFPHMALRQLPALRSLSFPLLRSTLAPSDEFTQFQVSLLRIYTFYPQPLYPIYIHGSWYMLFNTSLRNLASSILSLSDLDLFRSRLWNVNRPLFDRVSPRHWFTSLLNSHFSFEPRDLSFSLT